MLVQDVDGVGHVTIYDSIDWTVFTGSDPPHPARLTGIHIATSINAQREITEMLTRFFLF